MKTATIQDRNLMYSPSGEPDRAYVIATASRKHDGTYRWHAFGRAGRKDFPSAEQALIAAAKQMGFEILNDRINGRAAR